MAEPNLFWIVYRGSDTLYRRESGWTKHRPDAHQYTHKGATDEAERYGYSLENNTSIEPVVKEVAHG